MMVEVNMVMGETLQRTEIKYLPFHFELQWVSTWKSEGQKDNSTVLEQKQWKVEQSRQEPTQWQRVGNRGVMRGHATTEM